MRGLWRSRHVRLTHDLAREAKFYRLTREGRRQLDRELETWNRLSSAVRLVLKRA
jgi:DNA-binding PadR family transcriptional regulator